MANLTNIAKVTKKTAIIIIAIVLLVFSLLFGFDIGRAIYNKINPRPAPPAGADFGKLPPLNLSIIPTTTSSEGLTFKFEVVQPNLPDFGDRARVFAIKEPQISFLTLDGFKSRVKRFGFIGTPQMVTEKKYRWIDTEVPGRELELDISTGNFSYKYNYLSDQQILQSGGLDIKESARAANKFMSGLTSKFDAIDKENAATSLFKIEGGKLAQATSISESVFVRVNILRKDLEKIPFISAYSDKASISILISALGDKKQIAEAQFINWEVDLSRNGMYPIKTTADAINELKQGKGFVTARFAPNTEIVIQKVYLAYVELPEDYQKYLQPVYVFEGQFGFRAMVPAINAKFIEKETEGSD